MLWFGITLALFALARSGVYICRFGVRNYLRAAFRLDSESWMIIGVLMFVAIGGMTAFCMGSTPWSIIIP